MLVLAFYCCVTLAAPAALFTPQTANLATDSPRYAIVSQISLSKKANQVDGKFQIMEDARLTPRLRTKLWGTGGNDIDEDPALSAFKQKPLYNAQLRILASDGTIAEAFPLERPLAKLGIARLYGDSRPTYLVTVDYSAGFGSYSGPITMPVEVHDGHLQWLEAKDKATGKKEKIEVMQSLKTIWKITGFSSSGKKEILEAKCRPNLTHPVFASKDPDIHTSDDDFILVYTRYYYDGTQWMRAERRRAGFSEFEEGFPSRKLFP